MARKCKICGDELVYREGDHYKDTGRGQVLYTGVRLFTCPSGCRTMYYDFRRARPAGTPERILWMIPAPRRVVNVVDPILTIGLIVAALLLMVAFMATTMNVAAKVGAVVLLTTLGVWLMNFMAGRDAGGRQENS